VKNGEHLRMTAVNYPNKKAPEHLRGFLPYVMLPQVRVRIRIMKLS
jgi:hypothetical protein